MQGASSGLGSMRSAIDPDRIRLYAETIGISNVTSQGYTVLADELTDILKKIVMDAKKFSIHSRRSRVTIDDIKSGCKTFGIQPPFGYLSSEARPLRHIPNQAGEDFYVPEVPEHDLQQLLAAPLPPLPRQMHLRAHWLVFEGEVQPVPENIMPVKEDVVVEDSFPESSNRPRAIAKRRDTAAQPIKESPSVAYRLAARNVLALEHVTVKPIPPATLSVEKQAYVKCIIEACVGAVDPKRMLALQSLEYDTGLQEALSTITQIVKNGIRANVVHRCLSMLIYLVRIVRALASNKSVNLEPVLHQLIPSLITCAMGRQLCVRPETDNHWALRDFSGKTLIVIIREHMVNPAPTMARIVQCMRRVFDDPDSSFAMIYGTIGPLNDFMTERERTDLCRRFYELVDNCTTIIRNGHPQDLNKMEANKLHVVLMKMEPSMRRCTALHPLQQKKPKYGVKLHPSQ